ncbi:MAG: DUF4396 domain-containing protein [Gammaproteobacteria bacterium]|jgi:hypothetical protein|nr:DUF4396 domain-containing protein [Gammaproteobacteria bacterium]MBT7603505.1 DUF4396 domain-containing protein [Gammaproteobacteria bacterium]
MEFWLQKDKWISAAFNTFVCLIGCSIGDFGTILYFQIFTDIESIFVIMPIAIVNGILTSILLETLLLLRSMNFNDAIKTAIGMSLISMVSMELAMNMTDIILEGSLTISLSSIIPVLIVGFIVPWPYNYWRLIKYNKGCCK